MLKSGCEASCPACSHRDFTMQQSLEQKYQWLKKQLSSWEEVLQMVQSVGENNRWGYRKKVCLSARYNDNLWKFGVVRRDEIIPIPQCPVHSPQVNAIMALLSVALPPDTEFPLVYFMQSGNQVTLVLKTNQMPSLQWFNTVLQEKLAAVGIEGLWLHLHPSAGRRVLGKGGWNLIWGKEFSMDSNGLHYGPASFQQLILQLYNQSLEEAANFLKPDRLSEVVDLYCGTGSSISHWIRRGAKVAGVELGGEAVAFAQKNVPEALVLRGKCSERIPQLNTWTEGNRRRLLYANPPRTGLELEVVQWITAEYQPEHIAYLSCSAGTLRRDLNLLSQNGYHVQKIVPYDFFPQTYHVECLAMLILKIPSL